jgi:predicted transcriptional regulator
METETEKVLVLSNLTAGTVKYLVPASLKTTTWKDAFNNAAATVATEISLQPYQYIVLKN